MTTPPSPANAVFNTAELLEEILLHLGTRDVLKAARVCTQFNSVIIGSSKIQTAMKCTLAYTIDWEGSTCSLFSYRFIKVADGNLQFDFDDEGRHDRRSDIELCYFAYRKPPGNMNVRVISKREPMKRGLRKTWKVVLHFCKGGDTPDILSTQRYSTRISMRSETLGQIGEMARELARCPLPKPTGAPVAPIGWKRVITRDVRGNWAEHTSQEVKDLARSGLLSGPWIREIKPYAVCGFSYAGRSWVE